MIIDSVKEILANFREALLPLSNPIPEVEQSCLKYSNLPLNQIAFQSHDVCPAVEFYFLIYFIFLIFIFLFQSYVVFPSKPSPTDDFY